MDLNRLSMDLSAALEESRRLAARQGAAYIQAKHLLLALLAPEGALGRIGAKLGLDPAKALAAVQALPDGPDQVKADPGRQPVAGRTLRDLMDRAAQIATERRTQTVGPIEVALGAIGSDQGNL